MATPLGEAVTATSGFVCASGAGGKKTLLHRLAGERGRAYTLTGTVMTAPPPPGLYDHCLLADTDEALVRAFNAGAPTAAARLALGLASPKADRWAGVAPATLRDLHRPGELTLVKADGARGRPLKAPRHGEPVLVPGSDVTLVHVLAAHAIGQRLDGDLAHHIQPITAITGRRGGERITTADVAALLTRPLGAGTQLNARRHVAVLSHVDAAPATARRAAERALVDQPTLERVVLAELTAECPVRAIISGDRDRG